MPQPAPLSSFRIRPRFESKVSDAPEVVHERLKTALAANAKGVVVRSFPGFIGLHIPDTERKYWSPRLFLSVEPTPEGTRIEGIYGPEIEVWSVFLYGYLGTGLLGTFSGIYGYVQRMLGQDPWGLYVSAWMVIGGLALYLLAQLGQKLGADHTYRLHATFNAAAVELKHDTIAPW